MFVKQFYTGGDRNFGYLFADKSTGLATLIDPSYSPKIMLELAQEQGFTIKYVFNTHSDHDHTNGNDTVFAATGIRALLFGDVELDSGIKVVDGAQFNLGNLPIQIIHTPGHTQDSICIQVADAVFTGDTLFIGKVGGTDFGANAHAQYDALHAKLMKLPDSTRVFPGHDFGVSPQSTIGNERKTNPFLLQPDFASFVDLKKNWLEYKKKHGIA